VSRRDPIKRMKHFNAGDHFQIQKWCGSSISNPKFTGIIDDEISGFMDKENDLRSYILEQYLSYKILDYENVSPILRLSDNGMGTVNDDFGNLIEEVEVPADSAIFGVKSKGRIQELFLSKETPITLQASILLRFW
jgi:hypothetical protein